MSRNLSRFLKLVCAALILSLLPVISAQAQVTYNGSTNAIITFGVAPYGAPVPGVPTYIPNNVTLRNDILASPGGTFLTASPDIPHNIVSYPLGGPGPIPVGNFLFGIQNGGVN